MKKTLLSLSLLAVSVSASAQSAAEKILVPIRIAAPAPGANGSIWTSSLLVRNTSATPLTLNNVNVDCTILCAPAVNLLPATTYEVAPAGASDRPAAVLNVLPGRSADLAFTLRVQDISRQSQTWGTTVPVVRETEMRSGRLTLLDVPVTSAFRNMLRIYDIDGTPNAQVIVRLFAIDPARPGATSAPAADRLLGEKTVALRPPAAGENGRSPSYAEVGDLAQIAPLGNATRVAVEIETLTPIRFWAFVSVTNNETQHVTAIVPN